MSNHKKHPVKQTVIPDKVIKMAKFIQECDQNKQNFTIVQSRQSGRTAALKLARNNN